MTARLPKLCKTGLHLLKDQVRLVEFTRDNLGYPGGTDLAIDTGVGTGFWRDIVYAQAAAQAAGWYRAKNQQFSSSSIAQSGQFSTHYAQHATFPWKPARSIRPVVIPGAGTGIANYLLRQHGNEAVARSVMFPVQLKMSCLLTVYGCFKL